MLRIILCLFLFISAPHLQAQDSGGESGQSAIEKYGPRRQISTIVYMGLAGAVLGLSTLSFYGRPQDKLTNIPLGFGVGVIVGTVFMTYQAATNPDEFYRQSELEYQPDFSQPKIKVLTATDLLVKKENPSFSYRWAF